MVFSYKEFYFGMQKELVCFSDLSSSIFWSSIEMGETNLPSSVKGKLGGPSQRRLSLSTTTAVLQAVRLRNLRISSF